MSCPVYEAGICLNLNLSRLGTHSPTKENYHDVFF